MMGLCLRYARNYDDASEILQESFIKVFKNLGSFEGRSSFDTWMNRIFINTAISYCRKHYNFDNTISLNDGSTNLENELSNIGDTVNIDAKDALRFMAKLPEKCRIVMNLFAIEGYSHEEIAEQMEITVGTSKSQLFRARMLLKKMLINDNYFNESNEQYRQVI